MGLFSIVGRMMLDTSDFSSGMKRVERSATETGAVLKRMAGTWLTVGAVTRAAGAVSNFASGIVDMANAYDITTDQAQRLQGAALDSGVEVGALAQALARLGESRRAAIEGNEEKQAAFGRMGISVAEMVSPLTETYGLLERVGDVSGARADSIRKQADMVELLGVRSVKLTQAIRELSKSPPITIVPEEELRRLETMDEKWALFKHEAGAYAGGMLGQWAKHLDVKGKETGVLGKAALYARTPFDMLANFISDAFGADYWQPAKTEGRLDLAEGLAARADRRAAENDAIAEHNNRIWADIQKQMGKEAAAAIKEKKAKDSEAMAKAREAREAGGFNPFINTEGLAQSGFGYFGGGYNNQVLSELRLQVRALEQIVVSSAESSRALNEK